MTFVRLASSVALFGLLPTAVHAEGSAQLGGTSLDMGTEVYAEVLSTDEVMVFSGRGTATVTGPSGSALGSYTDGAIIPAADGAGPYRFDFDMDQTGTWDVAVLDLTLREQTGRVYSSSWSFTGDTYAETGAADLSVYFLVPAGAGHTRVVQMRGEGINGLDWTLGVNGWGVDGLNGGSSVPVESHDFEPKYAVYLSPPEVATYTADLAAVGEATIAYAESEDCEGFVPEVHSASFSFTSDIEGTYHIVCDLSGDGVYGVSDPDDLSLSGEAVGGVNDVAWDGTDNGGEPIAAGDYTCQVTVTLGEVHWVATDVETAYPGVALYEVESDGSRVPLTMFWNDGLVQDQDVPMPNGETSAASAGPTGFTPGDYDDTLVANDTSRGWGDFTESSKGNTNYLDTYAWLDSATSADISVVVIDKDEDSNGNGIADWREDCGGITEDTGTVDTGPVDTGPADTGTIVDVIEGYYAGGRTCAVGGATPVRGLALLGLMGGLLLGLRRRS